MNTNTVGIYRLERTENAPAWEGAMTDWCIGMVVSATSEAEAREVATFNHKDEPAQVWKQSEMTECVKLGTAVDGLPTKSVLLQSII